MKPTYMGFLEILKMPEVTSDEAAPGFRGSTVVLARLNETTPETEKKVPANRNTAATLKRRVLGRAASGVTTDKTHISAAVVTVTNSGGTRLSSIVKFP